MTSIMTSMQAAKAKWETARPRVIYLAIGLVVGPLISNSLGWQVTSATARADRLAGIVEQQALICDARARADVTAPDKLDWQARFALAQKWAVMPGATEAQSGVASACAGKLAV